VSGCRQRAQRSPAAASSVWPSATGAEAGPEEQGSSAGALRPGRRSFGTGAVSEWIRARGCDSRSPSPVRNARRSDLPGTDRAGTSRASAAEVADAGARASRRSVRRSRRTRERLATGGRGGRDFASLRRPRRVLPFAGSSACASSAAASSGAGSAAAGSWLTDSSAAGPSAAISAGGSSGAGATCSSPGSRSAPSGSESADRSASPERRVRFERAKARHLERRESSAAASFRLVACFLHEQALAYLVR